jgi:hypothetical protein
VSAYLSIFYAKVERGQWAGIQAQTTSITLIVSMVIADGYYFYDSSACPTGITGTGTCGPETQLTSTTSFDLRQTDGWSFKATGAAVNTAVLTGSATELSVVTFCANPTNAATAQLAQICFRFTTLYVPFPTFASPATGLVESSGTYTCGTYTEAVTLFDYKVRHVQCVCPSFLLSVGVVYRGWEGVEFPLVFDPRTAEPPRRFSSTSTVVSSSDLSAWIHPLCRADTCNSQSRCALCSRPMPSSTRSRMPTPTNGSGCGFSQHPRRLV